MKILLPLLFLYTFGYSQTTYKSLVSEYLYRDLSSNAEWLERDIIISEKTIVIKSYGTEATEIQTWRIQGKEDNIDVHLSNIIYFAELASGEKYEYPAVFYLQFDKEGKAETITCEIPLEVFERLPDEAPISVRFILD